MQQTLTDTVIKIIPSESLVSLIETIESEELTDGLYQINQKCHLKRTTSCDNNITDIDLNLIKNLKNKYSILLSEPKQYLRIKSDTIKNNTKYLTLDDLKCLKRILNKTNLPIYLHDILKDCDIYLPKNEIVERNPKLEKRCIKLRAYQQNMEYRAMTKNVDNVRASLPEDTISYQLRELNKQLIGIVQFIFSVLSGFVFGIFGVPLIVGELDFSFRIILGIVCAIIIAIAEIYFLAKKLNEYCEFLDKTNIDNSKVVKSNKKEKCD